MAEVFYMDCRLSDLKHKEVISAVDGVRIGVVDDIIVLSLIHI